GLDRPVTLRELALETEPDLLILDRETFRFAAAAVCFPSSWNPASTIGLPMIDVHGVVPRLNQEIGEKIQRFLEKVKPSQAFCRENWGLTRSAELDYHPERKLPGLDDTVASLDEVFLRIERQLFTGLRSGILMGVRLEVVPFPQIQANREVFSVFREKLATMPQEVAQYKGLGAGLPRVLELMGDEGE
ncbi:MAG: heme-dependent oxidative N-demethylase subunit alpha family protein, partial [Verrucomicrobiota bacterium]